MISSRTAFGQSMVVFAGSMVLSLGGFAFHAIASRMLGVAAYGTLYSLISLSAIIVVPGAVLAPVISRFAAEFMALHDERHLRGLARDLTRLCAVAVAAYVVATLVLASPAAGYFGVPRWVLPAAGVIAACAFVSAVLRALAQGMQDFRSYALSAAIEGVMKLAALAAFVALGMRLLGGALGFFAGALCGLAAIVVHFEQRFSGTGTQAPLYDWRRIALSGAGAGAMILTMTCIGSVDVVLVKHFFSARDAGLYAAAALGGKVLLYFVGFVPLVMLPRVTDRHARGEQTRRLFWESLATLLLLALAALALLHFFGATLLHALVGGAFGGSLPLLVPYGTAMTLLAVTNVLASYGVATHRLGFAAPLVAGTALTLVAIALSHASLLLVAHELLAGNALICAMTAAVLATQARPKKSIKKI